MLADNTGGGYRDKADFIGIFILCLGTLLYEVTLTRVFAFVIWSHFSFMVVSTALFGFGLAGVYLTFAQVTGRRLGRDQVPLLSALFGLAAIVSLLVIILVPLDISRMGQWSNWVALLVIYLALILPFFFAGLAISLLLSGSEKRVHKLYFFDLVGAAVGSVLLVFVITPLGASGAIFLSAVGGFLSALVFYLGPKHAWRGLLGLLTVAGLVLMFSAESLLPIPSHQAKRISIDQSPYRMFTGWSVLSRVDVTGFKDDRDQKVKPRDIWINGGENQSFFAGFERDQPNPPEWRLTECFPYLFVAGEGKAPKVAIIGSSGGAEAVFAHSHKAGEIFAVEMDPLICRIVSKDFSWFNHRFFDLPQVRLVNDEGRSFIANSRIKYDLIQMKNNHTPIALGVGSINLSETYLLTVEAMMDYLDHLTPDGMLAIQRWGMSRLATVFRKVASLRGIKNVDQHIIITSGVAWTGRGFFFRMKPFSQAEIDRALKWAKDYGFGVLYHPGMAKDANLFARILKDPNPEAYYHYAGFNLTPPTDNRPFFDHFMMIGEKVDLKAPQLPDGLQEWGQISRWEPFESLKNLLHRFPIPKGEVPVLAIAAQAIIISLLCIFLPLRLFNRRLQGSGMRSWPFILYFSILGLAFIMIELCYIKLYILFLGYPAISMSLIIAILLVFTGIGSFISERFGSNPAATLRKVFVAIFLLNVLTLLITPPLFAFFLGFPLWVRILVTVGLIGPMGLIMGMPFPLGLRLVHQASPTWVGWAWGVNGFMTVVGSIACVFLALYFGFQIILAAAGVLYLLGALVVGRMTAKA